MGLEYVPDASLVNPTWVAVPLSERDVAGQIPINFVTVPTVSLTAACFGNHIYDAHSAEKCISNLLVLGYRRLLVDLYWSVELRKWTFCPVMMPQSAHVVTLKTTPSPTATTHAATGTVTAVAGASGSPLYQLGPFLCSRSFDISDFIDILADYFRVTTSHLTVYMRYLSFNLHVASSAASPSGPAASVSGRQLPSISEHVSSLFEERLSSYIYKPSQLYQDRSNLNESWYEVDDDYKPIAEYFTIHTDSSGKISTPDGWPCSKYVQLAQEWRLFLEYGAVDPQLDTYDLVTDNHVVFPPNYMTSIVPVSKSNNGSSTYGCFYDSKATSVSQVNSSWAISGGMSVPAGLGDIPELREISDLSFNLMACGLSPTLNNTLFNRTADADIESYQNVSLSSSWAWAIGEPRDALASNDTDDDPPRIDRCVIMDLSLGGRWRATNCSKARYAACRVGNHPFTWSLSSTPYDYWDAHQYACPENTSFAVPRTGLENTYLYHYLLDDQREIMDPALSDPAKREVWLNLNSLDVASCWVTGGPETSCPYVADPHKLERRTVLVTAIAGIVICIITALTLFVKCNANRRNSRRGKRVIHGWEYEGVPS